LHKGSCHEWRTEDSEECRIVTARAKGTDSETARMAGVVSSKTNEEGEAFAKFLNI